MKKLASLIIAVLAIITVASSAMAEEYEMQRHFIFFNVNEHVILEKIVYDKLSGIRANSEISVFGYADQRGSVEWNRQLSQLRADFLASVIKKQLPGTVFREVTGIIDKSTADATTGEIRIFTPKRDLAVLKNALYESDQKVLAGLEKMKKTLDESDQKVLADLETMKKTLDNSEKEVLIGLGRVEDALKKSDKDNTIPLILAIVSFPFFLLLALLFLFRKRLFGKTEPKEKEVEFKEQYWPIKMNLIADMYLNKKNGDQKKKCPRCNADIKGRNYVVHLRKCVTSPLYGKSAEEAKVELEETQKKASGGAK